VLRRAGLDPGLDDAGVPGVDVADSHADPCVRPAALRQPPAGTAVEPDLSGAGDQLCIRDATVSVQPTALLGEAERPGQPIDRAVRLGRVG
jgi:hypothetical protein